MLNVSTTDGIALEIADTPSLNVGVEQGLRTTAEHSQKILHRNCGTRCIQLILIPCWFSRKILWFKAATEGDDWLLRRLISYNRSSLNIIDDFGLTPLLKAAKNGHNNSVHMLLEAGANPNFQTSWDGWTALYWASMHGHDVIVDKLLKARADPNLRDIRGGTALHEASLHGHDSIVERLLKASANPDLQDVTGCTALNWAVNGGYVSIIQHLLAYGAVPGPSLLQVAKARAFNHVASLLARRAGDDVEADFLEQGRFYPVYVCTVEGFLSMPRLLINEEACKLGYIVMLPVDATVVFFSHRWLNGSRNDSEGGPHPDRDDNYKYDAMKHAIRNHFSHVTHVWLDFLCVPQAHAENQLLAINSLPYIIRQCAEFVVLHGVSKIKNSYDQDEASYQVYNCRGWCRLECLSALAPLEEGARAIRKWRLNMDTQEVEHSIFESDISTFNPLGMGAVFYDEKDKEKIAVMVYKLAKKFPHDNAIAESAANHFPTDLKEKYKKYGCI